MMNDINPVNSPKRIYRSRRHRMIAGVCGGIADYFNWDPTWVRLFFVLFFFLGVGLLFIFYLIAWILIPNAPE